MFFGFLSGPEGVFSSAHNTCISLGRGAGRYGWYWKPAQDMTGNGWEEAYGTGMKQPEM